MKRTYLFLAAAALSTALFTAHESQADFLAMPQLKIVKDNATQLEDGGGYDISNSMSGSFLVYKHQGSIGGINLGWNKNKNGGITFKKEGGGTINYDDPVAIKVEGGNWLRYGSRDAGINLDWSKTPVYEWRIQGGQAGTPVKLGQAMKLHNTVAKNPVTYCYRENGAWLRWEKDCSQKYIGLAKAGAPSL